ncbi:ig-like domain-containing protein [Caerostris darwini]|uniref:Ig-like domain-containing protein n=1 Tax=Caerostris darwini TaxID=1538125 RepID=A0AAV4TAX6_9ARAC|nr:ig-like domain-containing protein [Caerostris darwini]
MVLLRNADIQNEYVRTGSNATLFCRTAEDVDNINRVIWYKEDRKIAEVVNGRRTFWDAGTHVNLQPHNNALYFRRVTYQDNGEYSCEINGKTKKSLARLFVQGDSTRSPVHFQEKVSFSIQSAIQEKFRNKTMNKCVPYLMSS